MIGAVPVEPASLGPPYNAFTFHNRNEIVLNEYGLRIQLRSQLATLLLERTIPSNGRVVGITIGWDASKLGQ